MENEKNVLKQCICRTFDYISPSKYQIGLLDKLREMTKEYAYFLATMCPDSQEKAQAFLKLEEVQMWMSSAIAKHAKDPVDIDGTNAS